MRGERNSQRAAGDRDDRAFGQQLPDDPPAGGAERRADRHLAAALDGAHELEPGEVGGADQHQDADGGEEQPQLAPRVADRAIGEPAHPEPPAPRVGSEVECFDRRARREPRNRAPRGVVAILDRAPRASEGHPDRRVLLAQRVGPAESGRHHGDDGVRHAVEREAAAERRREPALPERVGQHGDGRRARCVARGVERASVQRRDAKDVEERRRCGGAGDALRRAISGEIERLRARHANRRERRRPRRQVDVVRRGNGRDLDRPEDRAELHEAAGVAVGKRAEHDAVENPEGGHGGADGQRERGDERGGERRTLPQHANGIYAILEQPLERRDAALVATGVLPLVDAPEIERGAASGGIRREAGPLVARALLLEMELQFVVEIALKGVATPERLSAVALAKAGPQPVDEAPQHSSTCVTATLSFFHASVSCWSSFRPAAVSS